jgi:hypothetical protein
MIHIFIGSCCHGFFDLVALTSLQIIAHDDHAGHAGWPCLEAQAKVGLFSFFQVC